MTEPAARDRPAAAGFRGRLVASTVGLVVLVSALVPWLAHRAFLAQALPAALSTLESQARLLCEGLTARVEAAAADARALSKLPHVATLDQAGLQDEPGLARIAESFTALLAAKPELLQLRLLDVAGHERLRVDRGADGLPRRVATQDLQSKAGRVYVTQGLALAPGALAVTALEANREHGRAELPVRPVARALVGLGRDGGSASALLVVNVDLREPLLAAAASVGHQVSVASAGRFVLYPSTGLVADQELPMPEQAFGGLLADLRDGSVARLDERDQPAAALAAVTCRPAGGPLLAVILSTPRSLLLAGVDEALATTLALSALLALVAGCLAWLLASALARPVQAAAEAVRGYVATGDWRAPPATGHELDLLTATLDGLVTSVRERTAGLQHEVAVRRATEQRLEREAARHALFAAVVRSSSDAIYTKDLAGIVTSWNPGAEQLFGHRADEIVGRSVNELVPLDRRAEQQEYLAHLQAGDVVRQLETLRLRRDGEAVHVSLTLSPVRDEAGALVGYSGIARDIGERVREQERFRLAVEASPTGMFVVDADGTIVLANQETQRIFGYAADELLGLSVERLVPDGTRHDHAAQRRAYQASPTRRQMGAGRDLFGRRRDGSEVPVEIGLTPIETREGPCVLASVADISVRVRIEQELRRSNAELEQFAYVASHDLQEPLRMVASFAELLRQRYEGQLDEQADTYIHYAVDGARRMQQLVNDLLAFSRVGTRRREPHDVDLGALVARLLDTSLAPAIEDAGATVRCGALPVVRGDELQLGQLFQNLLHNALKFRAAGHAPQVSIEAERLPEAWCVHVRDDGLGIAPESHERIFRMFQRLHGVGEYPGSGIGLALARKIAEGHGGSLTVASTPGEGATFSLTLPAEPDR